MTTRAADFIERVASAKIGDARKKAKGLIWGTYTMYWAGWEDGLPEACALGIAELAASSSIEAIEDYESITEMTKPSHIGKRGARAKVSIECPFDLDSGDCLEPVTAEDAVIHINDRHSGSWSECRRLLRRFARLERKATGGG